MRRLLLSLAVLLSCAAADQAAAQVKELKIIVPAAPGGGWDQTGRTMQQVLLDTKLAGSVQVINVPGAGGTVGLAQFVNSMKGDANALLVGGYVMVGAIIANKSPVSLEQVTPIARLTAEFEAIVVPSSSPLKTMADLVKQLKADPGSVSWGGGSAGGVDHIGAAMIAKAAGVDPRKINYIAYSGGGEALASILGGKVTAGISGVAEFEAQVKAGRLRYLAVSAPKRIEGVDAPTLKESGLDVELQNWRMVSAPPGITPEQRKSLTDTIAKMAKSKAWQDNLASKGWADAFLAGDEFETVLKREIAATRTILVDLGIAK